jgi:hypothetical protein
MHNDFARAHKTLANPYPRTPAMAAGVADHVWSLREIAQLANLRAYIIASMRRLRWLIVAFVFLLALNVRAIVELWERFYVHRDSAAVIERLNPGSALSALIWTLVILVDLGVLWLTIRVARRLRPPGCGVPPI